MIYELTNQMKAQTFTQIVTNNLGNLKMIHKIQLLQQLLKITHNQHSNIHAEYKSSNILRWVWLPHK